MTDPTPRSIATDLAQYLREHPGVCAHGSTRGYHWLRFTDGEWRAVRYSGHELHLRCYVEGRVFDEEGALDWLEANPATPEPASEAGVHGSDDTSVWDDADAQDVFTDLDRCVWCGHSERTHELECYQTRENGERWLCPDCHESWERAGEIVGEASPEAEA